MKKIHTNVWIIAIYVTPNRKKKQNLSKTLIGKTRNFFVRVVELQRSWPAKSEFNLSTNSLGQGEWELISSVRVVVYPKARFALGFEHS